MPADTPTVKPPKRPRKKRARSFNETKLSLDEPTPAQLSLLRAMAKLDTELGRAPTTYEIAGELGYADHTGVIKPLRQLVKRGLAEYTPQVFVPAKFEVTPAGKRWL